MKSWANSQRPPWLPDGGAGRPNGLTEGVWFVEWKQFKITDDTPFAAARHFPQRGQRGPLRIRLGALQMVFCVPQTSPPRLRAALLPFQGRAARKKLRRFARNRRSRISAGMWADLAQGPGRGMASFKQVSWLMHHRTTRCLLGSLQWPGPCPLARRLRTDSGGTAPDSHRVPYSPPHPGRHLNALATPHNLAKRRLRLADTIARCCPLFCCYDTAIHRICQAD